MCWDSPLLSLARCEGFASCARGKGARFFQAGTPLARLLTDRLEARKAFVELTAADSDCRVRGRTVSCILVSLPLPACLSEYLLTELSLGRKMSRKPHLWLAQSLSALGPVCLVPVDLRGAVGNRNYRWQGQSASREAYGKKTSRSPFSSVLASSLLVGPALSRAGLPCSPPGCMSGHPQVQLELCHCFSGWHHRSSQHS